MGGKRLATKNAYQSQIHTYKERRLTLVVKYNVVSGKKAPDEFFDKVKNIDRKIKHWQQALRRMEVEERKIKNLDKLIIEFLGVSVFKSSQKREGVYNLARAIFYRHGMENGLKSFYMARYTGKKQYSKIFMSRLNFIRSFKNKPENRDVWYRWKEFISCYDNIKQAA